MDQKDSYDPTEITVRTVHVDNSCPDIDSCDRLTDVGHPDYLHMVATPETDPAIIAAHRRANMIGPGEIVLRWKRRTGLPEVPPA